MNFFFIHTAICVFSYFLFGMEVTLFLAIAGPLFFFKYKSMHTELLDKKAGLSPALLKLIEDKKLAEKGSDAARLRRQYRETSPTPKRNLPNLQRLRKSLAPMLVQLMKIDDEELDVEARVIDQYLFLLGFSPQDASLLRSQMAQLSKHSFDPYELSRELTAFSVEERTMLMEGLYRVTFADGVFHPAEEAYLRQVAAVLELDENFHVLKSQAGRAKVHQGFGEQSEYSVDEACLVLGLLPNSSQSERKERYKELRWFYRTIVFPNLEEHLSRLRDRALREIHKAWLAFDMDINEDVPTRETPPRPIQPTEQPAAEIRPAFQLQRERSAEPEADSPVERDPGTSAAETNSSPTPETVEPTSVPLKTAEKADASALPREEILALFENFRDFDRTLCTKSIDQLVAAGAAVYPVFQEVVDELMMRDWLEMYLRRLGEESLSLIEEALKETGRNRDWLFKVAGDSAGKGAVPLLSSFLNHHDYLYQSSAERSLLDLGLSRAEVARRKEAGAE